MTGNLISVAAEALVAVLLIITIGYCILLNSRLKRLRADESVLRATISELVSATEIAERAIGGLKVAALECDKSLSTRIREAEYFSVEIAREIGEGHRVLNRIKQIASAVRKSATQQAQAQAVSDKASAVQAPTAGADENAAPAVEIKVVSDRPGKQISTAKADDAVTVTGESRNADTKATASVAVPTGDVRKAVPAPSKAASRIEELRIMAEQARERLKEMRRVNMEKAA